MHWKAAITRYELAKVKVKLNCTEVSVWLNFFFHFFSFLFLFLVWFYFLFEYFVVVVLVFFDVRAFVMAIEIDSSWSTSLRNVIKYSVHKKREQKSP